jgi:hypothetical protein
MCRAVDRIRGPESGRVVGVDVQATAPCAAGPEGWRCRPSRPWPAQPRPYDAKESVGIAVGLLLAALHQAGLATLTHTPSPMRWLNEILDRPVEERAFVVVPVGYAAEGATVPDIDRKPLDEVLIVHHRSR